MAISIEPRQSAAVREDYSLDRLSVRRDTGEKLAFTDESGRAFNLTINTSTTIDYAVYRNTSRGKASAPGLSESLPADMARAEGLEAPGFYTDPVLLKTLEHMRQVIRNQILGTFKGGRLTPRPPESDDVDRILSEGAASLRIDRTTTVTMEVSGGVDTDYWSVEKTAQRLADFAISMYGQGDKKEHLQKMLDGMDQGYEEAKKAFGGWLPDISSKTLAFAKQLLTRWADGEEAAATKAGTARPGESLHQPEMGGSERGVDLVA